MIWPRLFGTVNDIKNELSQVILPAGAQRILDSLMDLAGQIEATDNRFALMSLQSRFNPTIQVLPSEVM